MSLPILSRLSSLLIATVVALSLLWGGLHLASAAPSPVLEKPTTDQAPSQPAPVTADQPAAPPWKAEEAFRHIQRQIETPAGQAPQVNQSQYHVRFQPDGLYFTPQAALLAEADTTTHIQLASLQVGSRRYPLHPLPAAPEIAGSLARLDHGAGVQEEFLVTDAGIQQQWWLNEAPTSQGDLRLTLFLESALLEQGSDENGFHFVTESGIPALTYGRATAIDATGRTLAADMQLTPATGAQLGYQLTIRLPESWLAQASYPLLIDPLISNPHDAPEDAAHQALPAIAYNNSITSQNYLVAWHETRNGNPDIYGQIVHEDTTLEHTNNFTIATGSPTQTLPAAAYNIDDHQHLVVWQENEDIMGQRVHPDGFLLGDPITIITGSAATPDVAYSHPDRYWLVTWSQTVTTNTHVLARYVDNYGNLGTVFTVSDAGATMPTIAANDSSGYLIAWQQSVTESVGNADIYARRVDTTAVNGSIYAMPLTGTQILPDLTYNPDDNHYFVVWQEVDDSDNSYYDTIYGRRGQLTGSLWLSSIVRASRANGPDAFAPAVDYTDDNHYFVAWTEAVITGNTDIMAQLILTTAIRTGDVISVLIEAEIQESVAVAVGNDQVLVAWTDNRHPTEDVYARFWQTNGVMEGNFRVHATIHDQRIPDIAYNADDDEYLVVWHDYRSDGSDPDIYGQRLTGEGVLISGNFTIATTSHAESLPQVAYATSRDRYLVVWQDSSGSNSDIEGQLLDEEGNLIGSVITNLDEVSNLSPQTGDVVYNSAEEQFFVVWSAYTSGSPNIWGRHVSYSGSKGSRIAITSNHSYSEIDPQTDYNFDDNEYLVVWTYVVSALVDYDIYGARVLSDGTVITPSFPIITGTYRQLQPDVVYEAVADQYVVVAASEPAGDNKYDIVGRLVSDAGIVLGSVIDISTDSRTESQPAIARDGHGAAMVIWRWWGTGAGTMYDIHARKIAGDGTLLGGSFALLTVAADQTAPALAGNEDQQYLVGEQDERSGAGEFDIYVSLFQAISASFTLTPSTILTSTPVSFTDTTVPTGSVDQWAWDFGDGSSSSDQHPSHTYTTPGTYTVTLTVTDTTTGETDSWTMTISVGTTTYLSPAMRVVQLPTHSPVLPLYRHNRGEPILWPTSYHQSLVS